MQSVVVLFIPFVNLTLFLHVQDLAKRFVSLNTGVETWIMEGRSAYVSNSITVKYDAARLNAAYGRPVVTVMKVKELL